MKELNSLCIWEVIEHDYQLTSKFLVGAKLFTQSYFNGDISTGGFLKVGFVL